MINDVNYFKLGIEKQMYHNICVAGVDNHGENHLDAIL